MKKMIVMVGFLMATTAVHADDVVKMPLLDLVRTDMDAVFEVKTTKFDKVLLDCQSLRMGISFSNGGVVKSDIYLNEEMCNEVWSFFDESLKENLPVCIGLDSEYDDLYLTRDEGEDCK